MFDFDKLAQQLRVDEGEKLTVYKDSNGYLTVGVGHFVTPIDNLMLGNVITNACSLDFLNTDIKRALLICQQIWSNFNTFPDEVQQICVNLAFNLGKHGLQGFHHFISAISLEHWQEAANQLVASKWYIQVGSRSFRLVRRLRAVV